MRKQLRMRATHSEVRGLRRGRVADIPDGGRGEGCLRQDRGPDGARHPGGACRALRGPTASGGVSLQAGHRSQRASGCAGEICGGSNFSGTTPNPAALNWESTFAEGARSAARRPDEGCSEVMARHFPRPARDAVVNVVTGGIPRYSGS